MIKFIQCLVTYRAPSHCLNHQCWIIVNWTFRNKFKWNFNPSMKIFIQKNVFENICKIAAVLFSVLISVHFLSSQDDVTLFYLHIAVSVCLPIGLVMLLLAFLQYYEDVFCGDLQLCRRGVHCCCPCWCPRVRSKVMMSMLLRADSTVQGLTYPFFFYLPNILNFTFFQADCIDVIIRTFVGNSLAWLMVLLAMGR